MNSFERNKIFGAALGALTLTMGLGLLSETIFHAHLPEQPGFVVEAAAATSAEPAQSAGPAVIEPVGPMLASADPAAGEAIAKKCAACHTLDPSGANKVGPGLYEVIGRTPGTHEGFKYSPAMVEFGKSNVWDYEHLNEFIANPKADVKGTAMAFAGLKKPEERAALIAYLRTLSAAPAPLPQ